eukprot:1143684-Pelagomonas_calceolata.AAC.3
MVRMEQKRCDNNDDKTEAPEESSTSTFTDHASRLYEHTWVKVTSPALRMWSLRSCQLALMGSPVTMTLQTENAQKIKKQKNRAHAQERCVPVRHSKSGVSMRSVLYAYADFMSGEPCVRA